MSNAQEVSAKVRELIGQMSPLGAQQASPEQNLVEDLGYDSVSFLELALAIEAEFDIFAIDEEQAANLVTVGDIEELMVKLTTAAA
ncbi:MAG TPA: phosphopantetheine-binding protein [Jatrophihabitans sp.]|nr:phosphopantetheine-binding protein [Jatrophihabitans sp.]